MLLKEKTFILSKAFGETLFARFLQANEFLKSDEVKQIDTYSRLTVDDLTLFIESAFWASLTPEEGRNHAFRISLGPPNEYPGEYSLDYLFSRPKTYSPSEISDLAPVLASTHKRIGVWYSSNGGLNIWGIADNPYWPVEIASSYPGQLRFSMLSAPNPLELLISGSWWGFVDTTRIPIRWAYFGGTRPENLLELDDEIRLRGFRRSFAYESIAESMLQHRHGGTLLIVPEDQDLWQNSLASVRYLGTIFKDVRGKIDEWDKAILSKDGTSHDGGTERLREESNQALEFVAQLTAVDGATVLGRDLAVYGFGAKLKPVNSDNRPQTVRISKPFEEAAFEVFETSDLGGTRHQSAAQFVHDQRDCVAIVCSEDGRLSALSWDSHNNMVQGVTNLEYAL